MITGEAAAGLIILFIFVAVTFISLMFLAVGKIVEKISDAKMKVYENTYVKFFAAIQTYQKLKEEAFIFRCRQISNEREKVDKMLEDIKYLPKAERAAWEENLEAERQRILDASAAYEDKVAEYANYFKTEVIGAIREEQVPASLVQQLGWSDEVTYYLAEDAEKC